MDFSTIVQPFIYVDLSWEFLDKLVLECDNIVDVVTICAWVGARIDLQLYY